MKKYSLVLTGGLLLFASCSSNTDSNASAQAVIDSIANVKTNAMQNTMAASNDSAINAAAKMKADSMEMAKHLEMMSEKKEGHGRREDDRPRPPQNQEQQAPPVTQ